MKHNFAFDADALRQRTVFTQTFLKQLTNYQLLTLSRTLNRKEVLTIVTTLLELLLTRVICSRSIALCLH